MLTPSPLFGIRLAGWLAVVLIGGSAPYLQAEGNTADAIQFVTPNSTATRVNGVDSVSVFAGTTLTCRWLIREPIDKPVRASLDVFQAMSATAVPIHRDITLLEDAQSQRNQPLEAIYQFEVPQNDRPVRYVLRMMVTTGGEALGSTRLLVRAEPSDKLTPLADTKITLIGFPTEKTPWKNCLSEVGITLDTKKMGDIATPMPDEIDTIFFLTSKANTLPARLKKLNTKQRLIVFQNSSGTPTPTLCRPAGDGWIIFTASTLLDHLADSPDSQDQLLHLLTEDFTNPTAGKR